jgi:hypothetical protein
MIFCKFNWGWYHFYFLVVKYNTEKYLMVFNIFLLMVRFCVLERQIFKDLSVQIVIKLFFEQFLKLQRRRDVVNLMPKKLIVVASNFFL